MNDTFERLEQRVATAVTTIRDLREENRRLQSERTALQQRLEELEDTNRRLGMRVESLSTDNLSRQEFETRKREIESRVEGILDLFTELDRAAEAEA